MRVRFAPSPTGALHIGGIRTALYNYLIAKKFGGTFVLRVEDTDQGRFVPGAEQYITEALTWCGILPTEGPELGGEYGPYRQSERKPMYRQYADQLIQSGRAYYAFDTPAELETCRADDPNFMYNHKVRSKMRNSLNLSDAETQSLILNDTPYVIRLKVNPGEIVTITDEIRGQVNFHSEELDDKVMLKGDGMPTYHLANVVDDYLMKITHVIRGEEWLPSTAHHVLLYQGLGWEASMPSFSHLPLILKPNGNGKLSKRDGAKFGIPVFPLEWPSAKPEENIIGFREEGFLPEAVVNFLAFLGWNPGTEQEIFSLEELSKEFGLERIHKAGARFDYDKAKWYNQQYIQHCELDYLVHAMRGFLPIAQQKIEENKLREIAKLMRTRVSTLKEFYSNGIFLFEQNFAFDKETAAKKWKPEFAEYWKSLTAFVLNSDITDHQQLENQTKEHITAAGFKIGEILPLLRLALAGTLQGPGVFEMIGFFGHDETKMRMEKAFVLFHEINS